METIRVERLDRLGLMTSVIDDLGLVSMIDVRLKPDEQEALTPGEAIQCPTSPKSEANSLTMNPSSVAHLGQ